MNTRLNPQPRIVSVAFLMSLGLALPAALQGQTAAAEATPATKDATKPDENVVVLSPFVVSTENDHGYAVTNVVSGSRVAVAIKDLPMPMQVVTSEFMNDIGATDLRKALSYTPSISLQTQNDLENKGGVGGVYGSGYGPGGVNNPEGSTANLSGTQVKMRGFISNNVLRDGFLRGAPSDSVIIDRVEVVQGPNALLYGTGNFGGVVDYLTKKPLNTFQGEATLAVGSNNMVRSTVDVTGPIGSLLPTVDYRLVAAVERSETNIDYQKDKHSFVAPSFSWEPTKKTKITVEAELANSDQSGYGYRQLRAAQGSGGTPINNGQLEATGFYTPPGANKRTINLSGPDTYNNQRQENLQIVLTQQILEESDWLPSVDFLAGYSLSDYWQNSRTVNAGITQLLPGTTGSEFGQTITITSVDNGLAPGVDPANLSLQYGTFDNEVVRAQWGLTKAFFHRAQERVELTAKKTVFPKSWYRMEDQVLGGLSALYDARTINTWGQDPNLFAYAGPNDLTPIHFGVNSDGSEAPPLLRTGSDNKNKVWDRALYLNNFFKFGKLWGVQDRVILMTGIRRDTSALWSTPGTTITAAGVETVGTPTRALDSQHTSKQNGIMVKILRDLSIFGLKADGFQPNFGGLHDALTGSPVGADTAKSKEIGIKFDFLNGKISGSISRFEIQKTAWAYSGFATPAPLGNPRFDPTKPIIYNIGGGDSPTNPWYMTPGKQAAYDAATAAGAITSVSPLNGQAAFDGSVYVNASTPEGAAFLDQQFIAAAPGWSGWMYQGNSVNDPGINNATMDDAGFYNGGGPGNRNMGAAWTATSEAKGWDGQIFYSPTDQLQIVLSGSVATTVKLTNRGAWIKYPYPQDRWATWYFPNGGFGLRGETLAEAYTDPTDTSTRTSSLIYEGDDTPQVALHCLRQLQVCGLAQGLGRWPRW